MKQDDKKEIVARNQNGMLSELKSTHELCEMLMKTPHYKNMGAEGIFAVVETAKSLGVDPRLALGGGLYYVRGKVEMSARLMSSLIRSRKHSITKDSKSNDQVCILHGKRADTGDCWTESFSIEEAKRAGLVRANTPWINFPRDMLFARALSRLARQLFSDIIGNCYVEGEIALDPNIKENGKSTIVLEPELEAKYEEAQEEKTAGILPEQIEAIQTALDDAGAIQEDWDKLKVWKNVEDIEGEPYSFLRNLNKRDVQDCLNFAKNVAKKRGK